MKGVQIVKASIAIARPLSSSSFRAFRRVLMLNQPTWNHASSNNFRLFSTEAQQTEAAVPSPSEEKKRDPLRDENGLLNRHVRNNLFGDAEKVFQGYPAKGLTPNEYTYNIMLNLYKKKGDVKSLFASFDAMKKQGIKPSTVSYSTMFNAFQEGGDINELLRLYQEMKDTNVPLALPIFNVILGALGQRGETSMIHQFLEEMQKLNFKPDEMTMTTVVSAYGRKGDIQSMLKQWDFFISSGVKVDERSFYPVLDAYAKKGNVPGLLEWFSKFKAAGFKPNARSYNIVIDGYARNRSPEAALQTYEEMKKAGIKPDKNTFINLIRAIGFSTNPDLVNTVDKLFSEMRDTYSIPPDGRLAAIMLQTFGRQMKVHKAIHVLEMVKQLHLGVINNSLLGFIDRLRRSRQLGPQEEKALNLGKRFLSKSTGFATNEEIEEVISILQNIKPNSASTLEVRPVA